MCTTLIIKTAATGDQTKLPPAVVSGRTMEFGFDLLSQVMVVPKGSTITPTIPGDTKIANSTKPGKPYVTLYGMIGANALGMHEIVDGINEHGLYFSALYFPGSAEYADHTKYADEAAPGGKAILGPHNLGNWVLGNCRTVHEVWERLEAEEVVLVKTVVPALEGPPPLHFIVRDPTGESIVIEPIAGKLKLHKNPVGVMTNSPPFDWHLLNLVNYRHLQPENVGSVVLGGGHELPLFGQGSGMFGLPGDSTPASRFIRAVAFSQTAVLLPTAHEAVLQVFHIMNCFDIPVGSITETHGSVVHRDYTSWTTVADLTNRQFYFRTYNDQSIRVIDVAGALDAAQGVIRFIEMDSEQPVVDVTKTFVKEHAPDAQHGGRQA